MPMTDEEIEKLSEAMATSMHKTVHTVLDERNSIDRETHKSHHDFVQTQITKKEDRQKLKEKVRGNVIGWLVITIISGIVGGVGWVGKIVWDYLKHNPTPPAQ